MLRFGETLGTLDIEVPDIKLMVDADPEDFEAILNHEQDKIDEAVKRLLFLED